MADKEESLLIDRPEELVYRSCYAPVDLRQMLQGAESRSKIRRLPVSQIFFGLKELDEGEIQQLLPHLTEDQWTGILDLDLWERDSMNVGKFMYWQRHILQAQDAVARKLLRSTDPEMWELTFKKQLKVYARVEDEHKADSGENQEWLETPDRNYLIVLPRNPEAARLLRSIILRLYSLESGWAAILLESSRFRTSADIEEAAYRIRTSRIEDLGFLDYFEAIDIYQPVLVKERLPEKHWERPMEMNFLPARLPGRQARPFLIFQAFANLTRAQEIQSLVEELFYVCNKLLSADRISPDVPSRIKRTIRKAITGINLGLDSWSGADPGKATEGVQRYYLQSFFQIGYALLMDLQREALQVLSQHPPEAGSFQEAVLKGLAARYPRLAVQTKSKGIRRRFIRNRADFDKAKKYL
ncbi:MAG: DUF6178 family protein [Acidobacteriota bacterium]